MEDIEKIEELKVDPGSIVIITSKEPLTKKMTGKIYSNINPMFPDNQVIVVDENFSVSLIKSINIDADKIDKESYDEVGGHAHVGFYIRTFLKKLTEEINIQMKGILNSYDVQKR